MSTADNLDWQILYASLVRDLQLDAASFQLLYPYSAWNWPVAPAGYTSAAQYNFCATMPQWSLSGAYVSSGACFDQGYRNFLSVLKAYSTSAQLQEEIAQQQVRVQGDKNRYDQVYLQAAAEYETATNGNNDPTFTLWLTTSQGRRWGRALESMWAAYEQEYQQLLKLVNQSKTPGLQQALADFADRAYYTRFEDPTLSTFPEVPGYRLGTSAAQWVTKIRAGGGTAATVHLHLPARTASESLANSLLTSLPEGAQPWTRRWIPVPYPFFGTTSDREVADTPARTEATEIDLHFEAWEAIAIDQDPWFRSGYPCQRQNGPFIRGYSGFEDGTNTYLWGQGGALSLAKTALLAAYNPTFELVSGEGDRLSELLGSVPREGNQVNRVGPFTGHWAGKHFRHLPSTAATETPMIFGVNVARLPCDF